MIQIRQGVFETNSSSTHSICIPKKTNKIVNQIYFGIGSFGWEHGTADPADYLYTAILSMGDEEGKAKRLKKLTDVLNAHDIAYKFEKPKYLYEYDSDEPYYLNDGYVDHAYALCGFVDNLLEDEEMLLRYLSAGEVYTGNDNDDPDYGGCYIAEESMWEYGRDKDGNWWEKEHPNPYHDEEKYDYFMKGN